MTMKITYPQILTPNWRSAAKIQVLYTHQNNRLFFMLDSRKNLTSDNLRMWWKEENDHLERASLYPRLLFSLLLLLLSLSCLIHYTPPPAKPLVEAAPVPPLETSQVYLPTILQGVQLGTLPMITRLRATGLFNMLLVVGGRHTVGWWFPIWRRQPIKL